MTLRKKIITGIIWNFAEQISRRGIGVIITLFLAYFLVPADYGLVAMMALFLAVGTVLMDSGFKSALIRLQEAEQVDFNTAFYANLCLGTLSYFLLFLAAPFIADFYNEVRLTVLIRVAGLSIPINAFQVVQVAILSRGLNFKAQLQATVPAGIISGLIAVALAYTGLGVWALIAQMHLSTLITTLFLWRIQDWRPTLDISWQSLGKMYNFGYKLFLSGLLEEVFSNAYVIVIAKLFTASITGHYFFAAKILDLVTSQVMASIQNVTYPALSSFQGDVSRLKEGYRKITQLATFILFPTVLILAALAKPLFAVLLPEKWLPSVPYLQLLCFTWLVYPLNAISLNILKVRGRSDLFLSLEIVKKIMAVIILSISFRYGVFGILIGQIIESFLSYIPNSYFSTKLINYSVREQIYDFLPCLGISVFVALVVWGADYYFEWTAFSKLLSFVILASSLYITSAHLIKLKAFVLAKQMIFEKYTRI